MKRLFWATLFIFASSATAASYTVTINSGLNVPNLRIGILDSKKKEVFNKRASSITTQLPAGKYSYVIFQQSGDDFETYLGEFNLNKNLVLNPKVISTPEIPNVGVNIFNKYLIQVNGTTEDCARSAPDSICAYSTSGIDFLKRMASLEMGDYQRAPWMEFSGSHAAYFAVAGKQYLLVMVPGKETVQMIWSYQWK